MANAKIEFDGSKLAQALIKFQADLPDIGLDSENPHFKSKFASLPKITKIILPKLAENGLSFTAGGSYVEGQYGLLAHLVHESGERESGFFPIIATDPQKIGAATTYARRYMLAALTGIVADADDDGNAASLPTKAEATAATAQARVAKATTAPAAKGTLTNNVQSTKDDIRVNYIEKGLISGPEVNAAHEKYVTGGKNSAQAMEAVLADLKSGKLKGGA